MEREPVLIRWYAPASVWFTGTEPKSVVTARSEPAGSSVKVPSGESQRRKMSARATTTRALAPLVAVTVKVFPDRVRPVTSPAVAVAPEGAAVAGATSGPAAARPATVRAAASRAAPGVRRRRPARRRGGRGRPDKGTRRLLRMLGSLMGQLLVRSGERTQLFGMLPAR